MIQFFFVLTSIEKQVFPAGFSLSCRYTGDPVGCCESGFPVVATEETLCT